MNHSRAKENSKWFYELFGGQRYEMPLVNWWFRFHHDKLIEHLPDSADEDMIIDIGCGPGQMLQKIRQKFPKAKLSALDLSTTMIEEIKKRLPETDARVGDAESLPWPDNMFDIVTNVISFHHYPNPQKALQEMRRVLKPEGTLYLLDIHPTHQITKQIIDAVARLFPEGHEQVYTRGEIGTMIAAAGFVNQHQIPLGPLSRTTLTIAAKL